MAYDPFTEYLRDSGFAVDTPHEDAPKPTETETEAESEAESETESETEIDE